MKTMNFKPAVAAALMIAFISVTAQAKTITNLTLKADTSKMAKKKSDKMSHDKMKKDDKMSHDKMSKDDKMSHDKMKKDPSKM